MESQWYKERDTGLSACECELRDQELPWVSSDGSGIAVVSKGRAGTGVVR